MPAGTVRPWRATPHPFVSTGTEQDRQDGVVSTPSRVPREVVTISSGLDCLDVMTRTTRSKCNLTVLRVSFLRWCNKGFPRMSTSPEPPTPSFTVPVETKGWGRCGWYSGVSSPRGDLPPAWSIVIPWSRPDVGSALPSSPLCGSIRSILPAAPTGGESGSVPTRRAFRP